MKKIMALAGIGMLMATSAFAVETSKSPAPKKKMEITSEQREKMAAAHEKMATCLRSTRPFSECHDEMMKSCREHTGMDGCPMMREGIRHGGRGYHSETKEKSATDSTM